MKTLDGGGGATVDLAAYPPTTELDPPRCWVPDQAIGRSLQPFLPPAVDTPTDVLLWYVVHLHGRREEEFRDRMYAAGVDVNVPMRRIVRRLQRSDRPGMFRSVESDAPAFPGYGFVFTDGRGLYAAKATNLTWSVRPVKHPQFLAKLAAIEMELARNPSAEITRAAVDGARFRVKHTHPIKYLRGLDVVIRMGTDGKTFMKLDDIGATMEFAIEPAFLEPL